MKKRIISAILSVLLILSVIPAFAASADEAPGAVTVSESEVNKNGLYPYLTNPGAAPENTSNAVVIPGVFQSKTRLYNDDGTIALNSEGKEYEMPFFLDSTSDIVKKALKKCLGPLLLTLITQHDFGHMLANSVGETLGEVLAGKVKCDSQGKMIANVRADKYTDNIATLTQEDKDWLYAQIPLNDYADIVGEDHLYYFSYCSFGNIDEIVDELYDLIVKAAKASPTGKANIVPISQGGTLANDLLARHKDLGEYVDRIIYIVPAVDGTVLLGDIYEHGLIDDDEALYREMLPTLIKGGDTPWLGNLLTVVLRILPNAVLNDILDKAADGLVDPYLKYTTTMWALIPSANYPAAAAKYLDDPEDAYIKEQTDAFHEAQVNRFDNIRYQMDTYGVEVFDICDYNVNLYPIADSWKELNGDGIIQLNSTSLGAYSMPVNEKLPDDYVPVKGEKYIDKYRNVDAGAGFLPDNTFYFHNQNHESTGSNDVIMKLAICLLTDKNFKNVDTYADKYPQFNEARNSKGIMRSLPSIKAMDTSSLSDTEKAEFAAAVAELEAQLDNTVVNTEEFNAAKDKVEKYVDKINGVKQDKDFGEKISDSMNNSFAESMERLSVFLYKWLGGKGFSDIFRVF